MSDDIAPVKRRRNRLYVPLDVEFATDPKILAAGPLAAYLFVVSLAYCKRSDRPGEIHAEQLRVLALGLPGNPRKYADALVSVGLWEESDDGWIIPAWLKHNYSPDQLEQRKATAKAKSELGNHRRHHEQKGIQVSDCALCYPDSPSPQGTANVPTGNVNSREVERRESEGKVERREGRVEGRQASTGESSAVPERPAVGALRLLLDHKVQDDSVINSKAYREKVEPELREEWRGRIAAYVARRPNATAEEIAQYVLHVPGIFVEQSATKRDWYANPFCPICEGEGIARSDDPTQDTNAQPTYGPCVCRQAEPYPELTKETA